jgi:hypothetical protein
VWIVDKCCGVVCTLADFTADTSSGSLPSGSHCGGSMTRRSSLKASRASTSSPLRCCVCGKRRLSSALGSLKRRRQATERNTCSSRPFTCNMAAIHRDRDVYIRPPCSETCGRHRPVDPHWRHPMASMSADDDRMHLVGEHPGGANQGAADCLRCACVCGQRRACSDVQLLRQV